MVRNIGATSAQTVIIKFIQKLNIPQCVSYARDARANLKWSKIAIG